MINMSFKIDYSDKVVTGGGSGIGRSTALAFASSRARVVVADLSDEGGNETIHLIKTERGGDSIFIDL
jgi:NAD(P)-dependent dehydrogenase (short-subunit alcohol dehydrogenase family)